MSSHVFPFICVISFVGVSAQMSTPNPTTQAQKLYAVFRDLEDRAISGLQKQTILGQHCEGQKDTNSGGLGVYWRMTGEITGKWPGFIEMDFGPGNYRATYDEPYVEQSMQYAIDRFRAGDAIIGFSFHMSYPGAATKSYENTFRQGWMDDAWMNRVINWQSDTTEYRNLLDDLKFAGDRLERLQTAGVPVLFRPFHEMNKKANASPFWWANRSSTQYHQLWIIMHDYFVRTRNLRNLIFVWAPYGWDGDYGGEISGYYPGAQYVDIVGVDIYEGNPYFPGKFYADLGQYNKPRIIAENDKMPVRWGDQFYASVSEIDSRPWVMHVIWGDSLIHEIGTNNANDWNTKADNKAIRDTYSYYGTTAWRVLTGGRTRTYDWSQLQ